MPEPDPYAGKVSIGKLVRDAASKARHVSDYQVNGVYSAEYQRINNILVGEAFVSALADEGCMIVRIPGLPEEDSSA